MATRKTIKPALGRILLRNLTGEERTDGGLWIPGGPKTLGSIAEVIAVCDPYGSAPDDKDNLAPEGPMYAVGDVVLIGKYNGVDIEIGRQTFICMNESDIIGRVLEEEVDDAATQG